MAIFNNTKAPAVDSPYLEAFNMESFGYNLLRDLENDSFKISLEFDQTVYSGLKYKNMEIVNEGFTDFFKKAAEFFRKLGLKIVEFTKRYMKYFMSYIQDFKKFLDKNSDFLRSLSVNFIYSGYEFQFPDAPNVLNVYEIIDSYNNELGKIDSLKYSDVGKMRQSFANENTKNRIRASVLNVRDAEVSQESFKEKSRNLFRKSKAPVNLTITNSYIDMVINEYGDMKRLLDDTERNKARIIKLLHDLEYFFDRKASVVYKDHEKLISTSYIGHENDEFKRDGAVNINYDENKLTILNSYFDLKYRESKFISNCLITVYMDKINAIKECMTQYRDVIRKALVTKHEKPAN